MAQGRCMKCKCQVEIKNPKETVTKNKMVMIKGTCPKCSTTVCRIVGKKK